MIDQLPSLKKRFLTYKEFGEAGINALLSDQQRQSARVLSVSEARSCLIQNQGNGKFTLIPLPIQAQVGPIYGMIADDFNGDGNLDLIVCGNDYGTEATNGRYDAMNGLMLTGNGDGTFTSLSSLQSGFSLTGDAKALIKLKLRNDKYLIAGSQNRGPLKLFALRAKHPFISFEPGEKYAVIYFLKGKKRKIEIYHGSSFLSQSSSFEIRPDSVTKIEFIRADNSIRSETIPK